MPNGTSFCDDLSAAQCRAFTLLVVEDEPLARTKLRWTLGRQQFETLEAGSGEEALELVQSHHIDLMVLDIVLPGMDGFEVCRRVRAAGKPTAIIMLTHLDAKADIIRGLMLGADDYIVKPFVPEELIARIKAVLRRAGSRAEADAAVTLRGFTIDHHTQRCLRGGKDLNLTPREFALLTTLCCSPGQAVSRSRLVSEVWGEGRFVSDKSLDVYLGRLRQKIEVDPGEPTLIRTVRGYGYVLE
jgi:DNA-binding response OmpR family regulator